MMTAGSKGTCRIIARVAPNHVQEINFNSIYIVKSKSDQVYKIKFNSKIIIDISLLIIEIIRASHPKSIGIFYKIISSH